MRAFIRVFPLLIVAAHLAACAGNAARETPVAAHYAAAARPAARTPARDRPDQTLLARLPSPQCERAKPLEGVPADQARAAMLDYAQQCYRQLADLAHARLAALQDVAAKTSSLASRHAALLERQPPPRCEPAKAPTGLGPAEAREAGLDAQRRCYQQFEAGERQKLEALQSAFRETAGPAGVNRAKVGRPREHFMTY
jgi:hypothetical protein